MRGRRVIASLVVLMAAAADNAAPAHANDAPAGVGGAFVDAEQNPTAVARETGSGGGSGGGSADDCAWSLVIGDDFEYAIYDGGGRRQYSKTGRWLQKLCDGRAQEIGGSFIIPQGGRADPRALAVDALASVPVGVPPMATSPSNDRLYTQVRTWLWVDSDWWRTSSATASAGRVTSTVTAAPTRAEWNAKSFDSGHRTVLVFTQYADTVDLLARELNGRWPGQVLAYTSGGGRLYDPADQRWDAVDKVTAKSLFRAGDDVKILVGTDTLAEGLNLQTCGRLFNYDMPWNFTRVEQRIGRVDRIGGHERVEVTNLFYSRTVEATIYRSLVSGFGGFDFIVGDAQPVLGDIEAAIQQAAFSDDEDQLEEVDANHDTLFGISAGLVANVRVKIAEAQAEAVRLSDLDDAANGDAASDQFGGAVTLEELAEVLLNVPEVLSQLEPHPTVEGAWLVKDDIGLTRSATLDRAVLAELSPDVRLLSPGDPLFDLVIARASAASDATPA